MRKEELTFYKEYEQFYAMAGKSEAFAEFCREAFGDDFSQDGFSDWRQAERILKLIDSGREFHVLDVGCGNGKLLKWIHGKTGAWVHGFDYSANAIAEAKRGADESADFIEGCISEVDFPKDSFDLVISMDTMYFAPDMSAFIDQIMSWLKKDGTLFVCYQEGDVMPKTEDAHSTVFARALASKGIGYEVEDLTRESYEILRRKKVVALKHEDAFRRERNDEWFEMLIGQAAYADEPYESYSRKLARYAYTVRKPEKYVSR